MLKGVIGVSLRKSVRYKAITLSAICGRSNRIGLFIRHLQSEANSLPLLLGSKRRVDGIVVGNRDEIEVQNAYRAYEVFESIHLIWKISKRLCMEWPGLVGMWQKFRNGWRRCFDEEIVYIHGADSENITRTDERLFEWMNREKAFTCSHHMFHYELYSTSLLQMEMVGCLGYGRLHYMIGVNFFSMYHLRSD